MRGNAKAGQMSEADTNSAKPARDRSTVEFPYADLDDATSIARVIHQSGGLPMDRDQIAVRLDQKVSSGAFVTKIGAARMFGLVEIVAGSGKIQISSLGHEALSADEARQRAAKAKAFLNVELYRKLYEEFRGRQLPPRPLGLEQAIIGLGVAPKQKTNARYAFDRSAKQAGYFDHGQDQLVAPVGGVLPPEEKPRREDREEEEDVIRKPRLDGVITALIDKLPAKGPWPADKRQAWLMMMAMAFDMAYGPELGVVVPAGGRAPTILGAAPLDALAMHDEVNAGRRKERAMELEPRVEADDDEIPF